MPTLCHPMNYRVRVILRVRILEWIAVSLLQGTFAIHGSNPGLPHHRQILYHMSHEGSPRILEWVAYPFCRGPSCPRNWTKVSCTEADPSPSEPWGKSKNTGTGSLSLLQGIFLTQESNRGLLHCRWILYQLSYQRSPYVTLTKPIWLWSIMSTG